MGQTSKTEFASLDLTHKGITAEAKNLAFVSESQRIVILISKQSNFGHLKLNQELRNYSADQYSITVLQLLKMLSLTQDSLELTPRSLL